MLNKILLLAVLLLSSCVCRGQALLPQNTRTSQVSAVVQLGTIDTLSSILLVQQIVELNTQAIKPDAIVIEINSAGGDYDAGFLISKTIERSEVPVVCIVDGEADSMAFYVLQSCDLRIATARSQLMAHFAYIPQGKLDLASIDIKKKQLEVLNRGMAGQYARKMHMSSNEIYEKLKEGDWWMTPADALVLGALDQVVP